MKTELTIDAIDTLIFNNFWGDGLPMVGHVKDDGYFLLKYGIYRMVSHIFKNATS